MTKQEQLVLSAGAVFKQCLQLLSDRSRKYSPEDDPFRNVRRVANLVQIDELAGIMTRFGDKLGRIQEGLARLRGDGGVGVEYADEPLKDSLLDAINYLTFLLVFIESEGGKNFERIIEASRLFEEEVESYPDDNHDVDLENSAGWFQNFIKR